MFTVGLLKCCVGYCLFTNWFFETEEAENILSPRWKVHDDMHDSSSGKKMYLK